MRLPDLPVSVPPSLLLPPPPPPDGWLLLLIEFVARLLGL
jgi:hypothetical protein